MAKESPTKIKSDVIDIKRKLQIINFLGNVIVEKDDSSMLADKMQVVYEEKTIKSQQNSTKQESKIKKIDAWGSVRIFTKEYVASGDYGYYEPQKNIFILEKNVMVNNGTSVAKGQKFIYDITTKKGNFIGVKDKILSKKNPATNDSRVVVVIGNDLKDQKDEEQND